MLLSLAREHTALIDPVDKRLVVRYSLSDGKDIAAFDRDEASKRNFTTHVADFKHPAVETVSVLGDAPGLCGLRAVYLPVEGGFV